MLSYFKLLIKKIRNYILYISFYEIFHKEKPKWLNDGLISKEEIEKISGIELPTNQ